MAENDGGRQPDDDAALLKDTYGQSLASIRTLVNAAASTAQAGDAQAYASAACTIAQILPYLGY